MSEPRPRRRAFASRCRTLVVSVGAFALPAAAFAACAGVGAGPVGLSERPSGAGGRTPPARDGGGPDAKAVLPPYKTTFAKLNEKRFVSSGHAAGRWDVEVFANDAGRTALATRSRDVPPGSMFVAEHHERGDGGRAGPVMVLEKRDRGYAAEHGDWRAVVLASTGEVVRDGVLEQCWGCHDDAPYDGLFPLAE